MSLNENIKLGVFDTLHDFWKERKLAKNDEEDEDNEPIDERKQEAIRYGLVNFLSKYLGVPLPEQTGESGKMINNLLKTISSDNVSSVTSNYERAVLKYYEEASSLRDSLHYRTTESLRYGDIIQSYLEAKGDPSKNILLQKYINSNGSNYILELSCGDHKKYSSFGIIQKNPTLMGYIANFVLNYYYPGITNAQYNAYFTFDAKPGVVAKTFRDIPEIYQLVTPANIADSAVTTFKALNNRNEYFFPDVEWLFNSNYYTGSSVQLKFLKSPKGFSVTNQFGFSLQVATDTGIVEKFDFSSNQKQGPSVNYLVDLMVEGEQAEPNVSSILNISKMASEILKPFVRNGLLFDVKRGGDYEQVNFATYSKTKGKPTIFSTIDILCSLYARTLSQNTVWHNGEKMTLYRFPSVPIDPALTEFNNMKHKSIDLIQELEILQKILNPSGLSSDIVDFRTKIAEFYTNGIYYDNSRKKGTPQMQSEVIINILIKIRLIDVMFVLGELSKMITVFSSPEIVSELHSVEISNLQNQLKILKDFSKIDDIRSVTPLLHTDVNTLLSRYENLPKISSVMKIIKDSFDLSPNQVKLLYTGENPLGLDYTFFTQDTSFKGVSFYKFNVVGNYKEIKFSNKFYSGDLYNVLNKFERMVNSTSSRGSKNLYDKLHKMDYFTFINNLFQSYFSKDMAESIYNLMQPQGVTSAGQSPTSDEACMVWFKDIIASELNKTLLSYQRQLQTMYPSISLGTPLYNIPASSGGSNTKIKFNQKGGAVDIVQVYELSDLLRLISGTAAQFVEGFITENFTSVPPIDQILIALMDKVNYNMCKETLDEVLFLFSNGLMTLQNQQGDGYEYEPTPSEFELLVSLSHMYDQSGNVIDSFYINASSNFYRQFIEALEHQTPTTSSRSSRSSRSSSSRSSTPSSTSSTGRGIGLNITRINDISAIYNTSTIAMGTNPSQLIPAEILNLLALTLIDNTMQHINRNPSPKTGYFFSVLDTYRIPSVGFDSIPTWEKVMDYYYAYLYLFSRSNSDPEAFKTSIAQIKRLSGGKKSKTRKNRMKRKNTRKRR